MPVLSWKVPSHPGVADSPASSLRRPPIGFPSLEMVLPPFRCYVHGIMPRVCVSVVLFFSSDPLPSAFGVFLRRCIHRIPFCGIRSRGVAMPRFFT